MQHVGSPYKELSAERWTAHAEPRLGRTFNQLAVNVVQPRLRPDNRSHTVAARPEKKISAVRTTKITIQTRINDQEANTKLAPKPLGCSSKSLGRLPKATTPS